MAHALQIDTLAFTKKLREAGAEEGLAEAIVEGLTAADTSELATKGDIAEAKSELKTEIAEVKSEIAEVKAELKTEIAEVKAELKTEIAEVKTEIAEVKTEIAEVKSELKQDLLKVEKKIDKVDVDLNWIKIIGGAIIAVLILPWLTELAKSIMN